MIRTEDDLRSFYSERADSAVSDQRLRDLLSNAEVKPSGSNRSRSVSPALVGLRPRRLVFALVASFVVVMGALTAAAAAGAPTLPAALVHALGWGDPVVGAVNADPATGRLLLTTTDPGPYGTPVQLWYADASDNGYCVRASEPGPEQPLTLVGGCAGQVGDKWWNDFGGDAVSTGGGDYSAFIIRVPGAQTVQLTFSDGTSVPLPVAEDWAFGWYPKSKRPLHPVVIGYDSAGAVVGRYTPQG